jgi:hypothetical protein
MPGSSLLGALPLGLLMFVGTALAVATRKWGRQRAGKRFPELAREFGLELSPPRHAGAAGTLTGTYAGRVVRVDPDDQRLIKVRFHGAPRVDLRSYEHTLPAPYDMVTIYSQDRSFDRFFRRRLAADGIARRIAEHERPGRLVEAFSGGHARQIQALTVTSEGVVCRFEYVSADAVRALLPACVALAELVEPSDSVTGDALDLPKQALEQR